MTKAGSNIATALLVRLSFEFCRVTSGSHQLSVLRGEGQEFCPKWPFKATRWCIKQIFSKYLLSKLGREESLMYLQLIELWHFVHYFSH